MLCITIQCVRIKLFSWLFLFVKGIWTIIQFLYLLHKKFISWVKMKNQTSKQRKTTLKWKKNGDLSEIDMLRILDKLSQQELNACNLTCEI